MFVQDLEALLASTGPMKDPLFQKSVFSLPRIILELLFYDFGSFWPPQILVNWFWKNILNHSEF